MRQLLLPVDPGDPGQRDGRWRGAPVVPGFGVRPLRHVLADVLAWRSRTAADEEDRRSSVACPHSGAASPCPPRTCTRSPWGC